MLIETKKAKEGDVWASKSRRTKIVAIFTSNGRWRVRYSGKNWQATQEAWADVYLRDRVLVERDGKPVTPNADDTEKMYALRAAAAGALFEYRRELLFFSDNQAPGPWDLAKVEKLRSSATKAMADVAKLDPEFMVSAVLSACANSVGMAGLRNLGLEFLPIESDDMGQS